MSRRRHRSGTRRQGCDHDDPDRLRRRRRPGQARSCRQPRAGRAAMSPASIFSRASWWQSGWSSCANWCPLHACGVLVNPANACACRVIEKDAEAAGARWGCKSGSSTPAPAARSMRPSQRLCAIGPTRSSSAPTRFSSVGASNLPLWRRAMRSPRLSVRDDVEVGGLMSYGTDVSGHLSSGRRLCRPRPQGREARRPAGRAVDQVRAGHQPANGAMLGLEVPATLLARADEVIE